MITSVTLTFWLFQRALVKELRLRILSDASYLLPPPPPPTPTAGVASTYPSILLPRMAQKALLEYSFMPVV